MSAQSTAGIDEPETVDHPSRSDGFVRGLSEAIGGPLGEHAVRVDRARARPAAASGPPRGSCWRSTCLTLALHWVQKSPCQDGAWQNNIQYTRFCYTDVLALYYAEGLNEGKVPYRDHPVEYPVVTGVLHGRARAAGARARRGHARTSTRASGSTTSTPLVLGALAVATVAVILALRRRRPWDAAMFALSPALLVTATVNWDLLAIGLAAFGMLRLGADARPVAAGVLLGLGGAAKLWPLFILGPILVLGAPDRAGWRAGAGHGRHRRRHRGGGQPAGRARLPRRAGTGSSSSTPSGRSTGARSGTSAATWTASGTAAIPVTRVRSSG